MTRVQLSSKDDWWDRAANNSRSPGRWKRCSEKCLTKKSCPKITFFHVSPCVRRIFYETHTIPKNRKWTIFRSRLFFMVNNSPTFCRLLPKWGGVIRPPRRSWGSRYRAKSWRITIFSKNALKTSMFRAPRHVRCCSKWLPGTLEA